MKKRLWQSFRPGRVAHTHQVDDVFTRASDIVYSLPIAKRKFWQRKNYQALNPLIALSLLEAEKQHSAEHYIVALILQAPQSAVAQRRMKGYRYHSSSRDKSRRIDELIRFNDTYVSVILALSDSEREQANDRLKQLMDRFCRFLKSPCFSNEQWEAITHGLGREIAVYQTAKELGYQVKMTSRQQDAMGVDMVIHDRELNRSINLDVKTRSSFHFRLKDLVRTGRIPPGQRDAAEYTGFCMVVNGRGEEAVETILLRIDEEAYGRVINFRLERPDVLASKLADIMRY